MPDVPLHLTPGSPHWPAHLEAIDGPPEELWAVGRLELLQILNRVAIVGTRSPSPYGEDQARRFAAALARAGACIVSGLARGIDQAAHEGALAAGGATIAVLGSGVDRPWPAGPLTERVGRLGLLLSEHPPGTEPRRHHFPLRNRLISGLCQAVLVVEAAHASGSLITARWAADQGREVFVVPGRVDHPMSRGTYRLLREGATPVESPEDLLEDLWGMTDRAPVEELGAVGAPAELLRALEGETLTADEIALRLGRRTTEVLAHLVLLEMAGRVARSPGGLFRRR